MQGQLLFPNQNQTNPQMMNTGYYPTTGYPRVEPMKAKMTTGLTQEEIAKMRKGAETEFSLGLTEEEERKCKCFHKDGGNIALIDGGDGMAYCPICHEKFMIDPMTDEEVQMITNKVNDVFQLIKTFYLDCPENAIQYFYAQ